MAEDSDLATAVDELGGGLYVEWKKAGQEPHFVNFRMLQWLFNTVLQEVCSLVQWLGGVRVHSELSRQKRNVGCIVKGRGVRAGCDVGDPGKFALCRSGSGVSAEQRAGRERQSR